MSIPDWNTIFMKLVNSSLWQSRSQAQQGSHQPGDNVQCDDERACKLKVRRSAVIAFGIIFVLQRVFRQATTVHSLSRSLYNMFCGRASSTSVQSQCDDDEHRDDFIMIDVYRVSSWGTAIAIHNWMSNHDWLLVVVDRVIYYCIDWSMTDWVAEDRSGIE